MVQKLTKKLIGQKEGGLCRNRDARYYVYHNKFGYTKTVGGLTKADLQLQPNGKVVSKKASAVQTVKTLQRLKK